MKHDWIPQVVVTPMLLWALYPGNPYAYYILLRCICCAAFVYLAIKAFACERTGWVWILGVTAVIYNPFLRIHLDRVIWSILNVITLAVIWYSFFVLKSEQE